MYESHVVIIHSLIWYLNPTVSDLNPCTGYALGVTWVVDGGIGRGAKVKFPWRIKYTDIPTTIEEKY